MSGVKKQYFKGRPNNKKKLYLEAGQRGFFCTCNFREKDCVKEAYNLLNEYADKLYGSTKEEKTQLDTSTENEEEIDISDQLKLELEQIKTDSKKDVREKRFQAVDTGASNCVFIRTNLPKPEELTKVMFDEFLATKVAKTRFLARIVPIMATCKANLLDITQTGGKLFDEHFLKEPSTFSIIFTKRFHNKLSRDEVIRELADLITLKNSGNKADLKNPKKAVVVEIIKGICLLSVVENYYLYRKFNAFEICKSEEEKQATNVENKQTEEDRVAAENDKMETDVGGGGDQPSNVKDVSEQADNDESDKQQIEESSETSKDTL